MTTDQIATNYKKICELKKQIKQLQSERHDAEMALVVEYRVNECNSARNTLALNYQSQINDLMDQINLIEEQLGEK